MTEQDPLMADLPPRLGEIGLDNFAPYLMNRIMGRYNASLRQEMAALGLTTPQMRSLAVLISFFPNILINGHIGLLMIVPAFIYLSLLIPMET